MWLKYEQRGGCLNFVLSLCYGAVAMAERADRAPGPPGERDKKDYLLMKAPGDYSR